jgi:hypothetical protein
VARAFGIPSNKATTYCGNVMACTATRSPRVSTAYVATELNLDDKTARLVEVCQELLPGWASVQVADIDVRVGEAVNIGVTY